MDATDPKPALTYDHLLQELEEMELEARGGSLKALQEKLANQFIPFQIDGSGDQNAVRHLHEMEPAFLGGDDNPDVLMRVEMVDFHLAENKRLQEGDRATMNITIRQQNPVDDHLQPLYWIATTGLDLYKMFTDNGHDDDEGKADLHEAFGRQPIEIPKGTAVLKFDVKKHPKTQWWEYLFAGTRSQAGKALVKILGLPGIALDAVKAVEDLVGRLVDHQAETLFASNELPLVLTQAAKDRLLDGNKHNKVGALRPGLFLLVRGEDYKLIKEQAPFYHYTYKRLFPAGTEDVDILDPDYIDPFKNITFAIFRVAMTDTKLNPAYEELNF
ncbi:MAG: hypothetical protein HRU40_05410 [Saprospiraceae bacterium]|nr:hypothetical protein [Saprospiraceae bacterium]